MITKKENNENEMRKNDIEKRYNKYEIKRKILAQLGG